jgi:hypothetical protein
MVSFRLGAVLALSGALACGTSSQSGDAGLAPAAESANVAAAGCTQSRAYALIGISKIVTLHAQGCTADADCVVVDSGVRCLESCPSAVVASDHDAFLADMDQYGARVCASMPAACALASSCAPAEARCVSGTCRMVETAAQ